MPYPLYVAFIWHQHQPLYKSRGAGKYHLPWVRLHGTKDYLDSILLLKQYPQLHQTVNLVPSLVLQLEEYAAGTAMDPYLEVALTPERKLTLEQRRFAIEHFFDANQHTMIDPHPRYAELYRQRQKHGVEWCLAHWTPADYGDLLAWHNLAWIDPLFWDDPDIARLLNKGRGYNLGDRQTIYAKQCSILKRIIPEHHVMQQAGQLEVITSPYTHPILPLLADTHAGRVALPKMPLPERRFQWESDIPRHLDRAVNLYRDRFGRDPKGLWPSEQSVSPAILPHVAAAGFQWLCSDEAVLGWTLGHFFHRDGVGNVADPDLLYRPYRLIAANGNGNGAAESQLAIVFRDHRLSDLIGFTYGSMDPQRAASDLVGHLEAIAFSLQQRQSEEDGQALQHPWLVTIALDGENCWEFYQQDGVPFLRSLYSLLSQHNRIQLVTVAEFLDKHPPTAVLPSDRLHSGSWVDGSFSTWIGDPVKNRAWDLLGAARQTLANHPEATEESNPEVWEALYAAEGSDWFWWFGEGHNSNQDATFDRLFREHLIAIYQALGEPIPDALHAPLEVHEARDAGDGASENRPPVSFIHPVIDGGGGEQDWDKAGRIDIGGVRGTMHRNSAAQRLWYGFDHLNLYLRLDFRPGMRVGSDAPTEMHLFWYYPDRPMHNSPMFLKGVPDVAPLNYLYHHHLGINLMTRSVTFQEAAEYSQWRCRPSRCLVSLERCLEIAIPWADLPTSPDWSLHIALVLAEGGQFQETLLEGTSLAISVP